MLRYYITDRAQLGSVDQLLANVEDRLAAGIEMIQLRERDLPARELFALAKAVLQLPNPRGTKLLINDRSDVAIACGAAGVHLRGHSLSPRRIRAIAPSDFLVGVSCHSVDEVRKAESEGASFVVLAPVYDTAGKGPALGLGPLADAARAVSLPVLALGGITQQRIPECMAAGAAGIAAISLFQKR